LFGCGTCDFVADDCGPGIAEQQIEHACRGVDCGVVAGRYRPAQAWRDVAVKADFAFVKSERQPGLSADRIGGRDLQYHRLRTLNG
jgi:hypothetical protein